MWRQRLYSKRTYRFGYGRQTTDANHTLTEPDGFVSDAAIDYWVPRINELGRTKRFLIERRDDKNIVGVMGNVCDSINDSPYADEISIGSEPGRSIGFLHLYASDTDKIPDMDEVAKRHPSDLQHILEQAHTDIIKDQRVSAPSVTFGSTRVPGSDWDLIATAMEKGHLRGGIFSADGRLIERLEHVVGETRTNKTNFLTFGKVTAVGLGVAVVGTIAWMLTHRQNQTPKQGNSR